MTTTPTLLSDRPSEAIRQAIADVVTIENTKNYKIFMHSWFESDLDRERGETEHACSVCFGGAVMARCFDYLSNGALLNRLFPDGTPDHINQNSFALNPTVLERLGYDKREIDKVGALDSIRNSQPSTVLEGVLILEGTLNEDEVLDRCTDDDINIGDLDIYQELKTIVDANAHEKCLGHDTPRYPVYERDPEGFKASRLALANALETAGY